MDSQSIVEYAMQCGAVWAGIEPIAMHKDRLGVAISFPDQHDAIEFCYYARDWLHDAGFSVKITRYEEFVLIWL